MPYRFLSCRTIRKQLIGQRGVHAQRFHRETRASAVSETVTQPCISNLVRRQIGRFSIDTLGDMLARIGVRVRVHVAAPPTA